MADTERRSQARTGSEKKKANADTQCCVIYAAISVKRSSYIESRKFDCYTTFETWPCIKMGERRL